MAQIYHMLSSHYCFLYSRALPYFALPTFLALTGAAVSTRNTYLCIVVWRRTMRKIRTIGFLDTSHGHHWQRILLTLCAYLMCLFSVSDVRYVRQHLVHVFSWRKEIVITKIKNPMDMFGLDNVHEKPKMSNYLSSTLFTKNNEINYKIIINCKLIKVIIKVWFNIFWCTSLTGTYQVILFILSFSF